MRYAYFNDLDIFNMLILFTLISVIFLHLYCVTDMPRQPHQRKVYARMDFFQSHVFYERNNAVPIETASLFSNLSNSSEYITGI